MRQKEPLIEYSYSKLISDILKLCEVHKIKATSIGEIDNKGTKYKIYKLVVNPTAKKKFCLVAGVHGYEIAGPLSIQELLANKEKYLRDGVQYTIYPVLNPVSFDLRQRHNGRNRDINALYKTTINNKNYPELAIFLKDTEDKKFHTFVSFHEDVDTKNFYVYGYGKKLPIFEKLVQASARYCSPLKTKSLYKNKVEGGIVMNRFDRGIEEYIYYRKQAEVSICTETPGKIDLEKRIKINLNNIRILSDNAARSLD